jgi:hypothetical protein
MAKTTDLEYEFWGILLVITAIMQPNNTWKAIALVHTAAGVAGMPAHAIGTTRDDAIRNLQRLLLEDMERAWTKNLPSKGE